MSVSLHNLSSNSLNDVFILMRQNLPVFFLLSVLCILFKPSPNQGGKDILLKEESKKAGLKLNIQKTKIMASIPSLHGK